MDLLLFLISSGIFFFIFLWFPKREKYGTLYTFLAIVSGAMITNLGIEPMCGENWLSSSIGRISSCSTDEGAIYIINDFGMRFLIIMGLLIGAMWFYHQNIQGNQRKYAEYTISKIFGRSKIILIETHNKSMDIMLNRGEFSHPKKVFSYK